MTRSHEIPRNAARRCRRTLRPCAETLEGRLLLNAGDLDTTFGNGGYVVLSSTQATKTSTPSDIAYAENIRPDGKLLVAGQGNGGFQVVRLTSTGALDASFGSGGRVLPLSGGGAQDMAVQATDGGIVLAGMVSVTTGSGKNAVTGFDVALVRLLANGTLDTTFGQGGKVITGISTSKTKPDDLANAVAIQSDGKIVVGGSTTSDGTYNGNDSFLLRYNTNGSLDDGSTNDSTPGDSFGQGGKVVTVWSSNEDFVSDLAIQGDKIVVTGGFTTVPNPTLADYKPYVARYNANGSVDTNFGTGGFVTTPGTVVPANGPTQGLALQADGSIVASVKTFNGSNWDLALARYTTTGVLDTAFGGGTGLATVKLPGDERAFAVTIQSDGKLLAAGSSNLNTSQSTLLARFQSNGAPDPEFGSGGVVLNSFSSYDWFRDVALQADGKMVAIGRTSPPGKTYPAFLVARYLGDSGTLNLMASREATNAASLSMVGPPSELLMGTTGSDQDLTMLATELVRSHTKRPRGSQAMISILAPIAPSPST